MSKKKTITSLLIDIFFYGNIFIAIAAVALAAMTLTMNMPSDTSPTYYYLFLFFGTLGLYNVHRLIGINNLENPEDQQRFLFVHEHKNLVIFITIVSSLFLLFPLYKTFAQLKWIITLPLFIGIFYALPLFSKRIRDLPYIKIFLIAFCWSFLTVYCPLKYIGLDYSNCWLLLLERFLFVFAITIPFDIRDHDYDQKDNLKTMVSLLGVPMSKFLSCFLIILVGALNIYMYWTGDLPLEISMAWLITYILSLIAIKFTHKNRYELYFIGLLDGLMIAPFVIFLLISVFYA